MSESRGPVFNPWWGLLLLVPAALFAGKLIGGMPAPAPTAQDAAAQAAQPNFDGIRPHVEGASPSGAPADGGANGGPVSAPGLSTSGDVATPEGESAGGGGVHWMRLSEAMSESQRSGKPILFDFNADWCGPCQRLKHEAFEDPAIARTIEACVAPVSVVDRKRELGNNPQAVQELQDRFKIEAFPTLIVINPQTGKAVRVEGYGGADQAQAWIQQAAAAVK